MTVRLYMDVHVPRAVTIGLRLRQVDVITAQEDGAAQQNDEWLIQRATELNRVLFSQDHDFLRIADTMQRKAVRFTGLIYVHQLNSTTGQLIGDLELIAKAGEMDDFQNRIEYIPLR